MRKASERKKQETKKYLKENGYTIHRGLSKDGRTVLENYYGGRCLVDWNTCHIEDVYLNKDGSWFDVY